MRKPAMTLLISYFGLTMMASVAPAQQVLVAGGYDDNDFPFFATDTAELYDPSTQTFAATTGNMNSPRGRGTAIRLQDDRVLLLGGDGAAASFVKVVSPELYDPSTETFSLAGSASPSRPIGVGIAAALLKNGKILTAGGCPSPAPCTATAYLYDPATDMFTATGNMTEARGEAAAVTLMDGRVLVVGGTRDGSAEIYDPESGTFSATGSMVTQGIPTSSTATLLCDGTVLVTEVDSEIYNPATGTFAVTRTPVGPAIARLPDGEVLLAGGVLYNPRSGQVIPPKHTNVAIGTDTGAELANGDVVFAGGKSLSQPLASAELYHAKNRKVTSIGNMNVARTLATATTLAKGPSCPSK